MTNVTNTLNLLNETTTNLLLTAVYSTFQVENTTRIVEKSSIKDPSNNDDNGDINAGIIAACCAGGLVVLFAFVCLVLRYKCRSVSTPLKSNKRRFQENFDNKNFVFEDETLKIERPLPPEPKNHIEVLERAEEAIESLDLSDGITEKKISNNDRKINGDINLSEKSNLSNGETVVEVHRELTESEKNLRDLTITPDELDYQSSINEIDKVLNNLVDEESI
ncbi:DgyrCDS13918 [Dimorphilus gyrociliatus]|uniref:DgyrCDS13918 n=1 Tax=Dimorphilus gyrociliatus TaxID=2664684 RepID=A0A7I8WC21_9ANNE|nr:DgyrCDS13918 [Dimorphilus gyrociliatus]